MTSSKASSTTLSFAEWLASNCKTRINLKKALSIIDDIRRPGPQSLADYQMILGDQMRTQDDEVWDRIRLLHWAWKRYREAHPVANQVPAHKGQAWLNDLVYPGVSLTSRLPRKRVDYLVVVEPQLYLDDMGARAKNTLEVMEEKLYDYCDGVSFVFQLGGYGYGLDHWTDEQDIFNYWRYALTVPGDVVKDEAPCLLLKSFIVGHQQDTKRKTLRALVCGGSLELDVVYVANRLIKETPITEVIIPLRLCIPDGWHSAAAEITAELESDDAQDGYFDSDLNEAETTCPF